MKNLRKILSIVLALMMVVSLFAACGDKQTSSSDDDEDTGKKKTEQTEKAPEEIKPEDVLLGDWDATLNSVGIAIPITFTFEKGGALKTTFTKADYDELITAQVDELLKEEGIDNLTDEQKEAVFAEMGVTSMDEVKNMFRDMLVMELPYDEFASEMELEGTWSLDGDTLTVDLDGETIVVETGLSKGEKSIHIVNEETGLDVSLKKA